MPARTAGSARLGAGASGRLHSRRHARAAAQPEPHRAAHAGRSGAAPNGRRRPLLGVGIFLAYLVPAVVAYWRVWSADPASTAIAGGAGDPAQYEWLMAWVPWALTHGHNVLATRWVNWPFGIDVLAQPAMPALGMIGAPVTALWGPVATLNVWFTLAFPLSAGSAYLLARRFSTWRPAAFAAGLLYGFSPYMVVQAGYHLDLAFVPIPPLVFLVLHELVVRQERPAWRSGIALGSLLVVQYFISSEVLATTVMFGALATVVVALRGWRDLRSHAAHAAGALAVAALLAGAVLVYPIEILFSAPDHITGKIPGFDLYYNSLAAPLLPTSAMRFGTSHMKAMGNLLGGNATEDGTYLGPPLVVLAAAAVVAVRRRTVRVAGLLALLAFVLSLGATLHFGLVRLHHLDGKVPLPAAVLGRLPLIADAFPERWALYVVLFLSVLLAATLDAVHDKLRPDGRALAAGVPAVVAVLVLLPLVPTWPYQQVGPTGVPSFFTTSAVDRVPAGSVALVYPFPTDLVQAPQLWQAEASFRFKMPGGYFVVPLPGGGSQYNTVTPVYDALQSVLQGPPPQETPALRSALRADLAAWKVRTVIAQPAGPNHPVAFLTWLVGRPPDAVLGGVDVWDATTW